MIETKWDFWITIMSVAKEYMTLDKSSDEAKEHIEHAEKLFKEEYIIPQTEIILERL